MTNTTAQVKFRDDFSPELAGMVFEIDGDARRDADGREIIGLRIRRGRRWAYRLAYVADLRTTDGAPFAPIFVVERAEFSPINADWVPARLAEIDAERRDRRNARRRERHAEQRAQIKRA